MDYRRYTHEKIGYFYIDSILTYFIIDGQLWSVEPTGYDGNLVELQGGTRLEVSEDHPIGLSISWGEMHEAEGVTRKVLG
jgi:hypothetical protein